MVDQFELERFEWQAPDRLEVAGKFHGVQDAAAVTPVLVVSGGGTAHRLEAETVAGPPEDGKSWRAQFVWDEAPVGVEAATLELGPDVVVDLPPPGAQRALLRPRSVDEHEHAGSDVALQAELLAAEQEAQELRAALERAEAELARARADVDTERTGRAADAERFREGLARVRALAEQALTEAQQRGQQAEADLSSELEAEQAARAQAESDATALREQVAEADELRQRLTVLQEVGAEADETRAEAQRLLERLTKLVDSLNAGS
jgi:DNA repair exonuclease SbcCD ATPase subunit